MAGLVDVSEPGAAAYFEPFGPAEGFDTSSDRSHHFDGQSSARQTDHLAPEDGSDLVVYRFWGVRTMTPHDR